MEWMCLTGRIALLALMIAGAAHGAIIVSGSVVDETGNPVAGARVTADSGGTPGTIAGAGTSNAAGSFRFEISAAGDYRLRVEREGFFLLTNTFTHLDSNPVDIHLTHLKELAESIDVPYSPPVVDPEQTAEVKRLDGQVILNLPFP